MLSTADRPYPELPNITGYSAGGPHLVLVRPSAEERVSYEGTRRILNILVASVLLVLALPVMLAVALAIRLTSPGPILYTQLRVGIDRRTGRGGNWRRVYDYGGRLFTIYKFRTMTASPGMAERQVWASPDDPRVTRLGRFLRKYRLDELPQLINVLKGDMNVVGPRPEQPAIFADLREKIDHYPARQRVLPGITGWAQVNQCYDRCLDDVRRKVILDIEYLNRASAREDLKILLRTVPVVLLRKGAW